MIHTRENLYHIRGSATVIIHSLYPFLYPLSHSCRGLLHTFSSLLKCQQLLPNPYFHPADSLASYFTEEIEAILNRTSTSTCQGTDVISCCYELSPTPANPLTEKSPEQSCAPLSSPIFLLSFSFEPFGFAPIKPLKLFFSKSPMTSLLLNQWSSVFILLVLSAAFYTVDDFLRWYIVFTWLPGHHTLLVFQALHWLLLSLLCWVLLTSPTIKQWSAPRVRQWISSLISLCKLTGFPLQLEFQSLYTTV